MSRVLSIRLPLAIVALVIGSGTLQAGANKLLVTSTGTTLTCSTIQGDGPIVTLTVKPVTLLATGQTLVVGLPSTFTGGLVVTPPSVTTLSTTNQAAGLIYTVNLASNCTGVSNGTASFAFTAGGVADATYTATTTKYTTELALSPASLNLSCSTQTGPPAPVPVTVKPVIALTPGQTIAVGLPGSLTGGLVITPPSTTTLSTTNQANGLIYTVGLANGCVGVANNSTPSITFTAAGQADAVLPVNTTLNASVSGLTVSSSQVTVNCVMTSGPTYTPGAAQTLNVTSSTPGGIPFTVVNTGLPTGVTVSPNTTTGGTAGGTAIPYSFVAVSPCGGGSPGTSTSGSFVLKNPPAADKTVTVTLQVTNATPLIATPGSNSLTYTKGSGTPSTIPVTISSNNSPAPFFTVDTTSLPIWLTVDSVSGTVPKTLHFSTTSICDSLAPGTYPGSVRLKVATYGDLTINFSLFITNPSPKLTIAQGASQTMPWVMGQNLPTAFITLVSSDSPIQYSLASGGTLNPVVSAAMQSGLAYNFGTQIPVSFDPSAFGAAQPATTLTGTITVTWGNPASTTVETFLVTVQSPNPTLSSISPGSVPTASAGQQFTVVLNGTGFVQSSDPMQKTKVGVLSGGTVAQDTNISSNVISASQMILTITAATGDTYLPFSAGGSLTIAVCNPQGIGCTTPEATVPFSISAGPVIQAVTSASSYQEVTPGATQNIAPYDMISIFGSNFCAASSPQCSSSDVLTGVLDANLVYQNWLAQDVVGQNGVTSGTQRKLTVSFCPTGQTTGCTNAPLLFATNNQINALVPGGLTTGNTIDIIVSYGYATGTTMAASSATTVNVIAADPGIFAIGADGQGSGAILAADWSLIGSTNPAGMRSGAGDSDYIQIYMTGLGVPNSKALNSTPSGSSTAPTDCIDPGEYLNTLNAQPGASYTTLDGAVIQSALLFTGKLAPCMKTLPSILIGGVAASTSAPVGYAGWVADSIAGLYQVNAKLPASTAGPFTDVNGKTYNAITAPVQLPIQVSFGGQQSQTGVSLWVAPRLKVVAPSGAGLSGTVGVAWSTTSNAVIASEGTSPYRYAVTSGVLPTGLTLTASGTNAGKISGSPAANTSGSYVITVTATDSANVPLTGTATFTLQIGGGLVVASSPASYTGNVVTDNTTRTLTTITATGGAYPYTYSWDNSFTAPAGMNIGLNSGIVTINNQTPGQVYTVVVDASDTNGWTGKISFTVTLNLIVSATSGNLTGTSPSFTGDATTGPYSVSLTSVGGAAYTYTIPEQAGFAISGSTLNITSTTPGTYTIVVTSTEKTTAATGTLSLTIKLLPHLTVTSSSSSLTGTSPNWSGAAGSTFTVTVSTSGGTGYTYAAQSTPGGFSFSGTTLTIANSVAAGQYSVTITSTDTASGATGQIVLNITLVQLTVTSSSSDMAGASPNYTDLFANGPFHVTLATTGGTSYTYTLTPQTGFALSGNILTITAPQGGPYSVVITSTDTATNVSAQITLSITLN
jgi:hypothetical protein